MDEIPNLQKLPTAEVRLAGRLRQLRAEKDLTLARLAEAAQISTAYLSRVENHKVAITIAVLERLARALGVPMKVFFDDNDVTPPIIVCRAGQGTKTKLRGRQGVLVYMLAAAKRGKLMEPLIADIGTATHLTALKSHAGEEFNYLIEGECDFRYGKECIRLRRGDAAYYDASVPHTAHAVKGKPCRILSVVASREYLFHGDLTRLLNGGEE